MREKRNAYRILVGKPEDKETKAYVGVKFILET
jgi:hypothetical protein